MGRKRSFLPFLICIIAVAGIVAAAILFFEKASSNDRVMDAKNHFKIISDNEAAIIVNDELLEEKGVVRNGEIYLSYPLVWEYLNSSFYWESDTGQMLLTLPSGTEVWVPGEGKELVMIDQIPYLSASCVKQNSDIDLDTFTDPERVVARTDWTNVSAETATKDTVIRARDDKKGEIIKKVSKGDKLILLGKSTDLTNSWYKVSSPDGFVGYVERMSVTAAPENTISHTTSEKFVFPHIFAEDRVCMGWQYVESEEDAEMEKLVQRTNGMNTISPTWFRFASDDGDIQSLAKKGYVSKAHKKGLQVWGCLQDVQGSPFSIGTILETLDRRTYVIDQILAAAEETGMDGINVDIETVTEESAPQYLQFIRELSVAAHDQGLIVSSDTFVPVYTEYYDRGGQAKTVDYIVLMAYDEHTVGSAAAGSVASLPFVEEGIRNTLETVPAEQIVLGMPFYTRGWALVEGEERPQSKAMGMNDAEIWANDRGISLYWDSSVGQNVGSAEGEGVRYSIWMEDEKSLEEKLKLMDQYKLAGGAFWRLGLERSAVWNTINQYFS
ncbi:MAG: SH3 domain-containing protein [Eubacterium sp.]|nr:SH3 domain-containing protein [Eubacterium sp.]